MEKELGIKELQHIKILVALFQLLVVELLKQLSPQKMSEDGTQLLL